jgi:hypothetical protein
MSSIFPSRLLNEDICGKGQRTCATRVDKTCKEYPQTGYSTITFGPLILEHHEGELFLLTQRRINNDHKLQNTGAAAAS